MSHTEHVIVQTTVNVPVEKAWELWTAPEHITRWNAASDDWHSPRAENDLREGGSFVIRMEAKDESVGFDFGGTYTRVINHKEIAYTMDDDRKVSVMFEDRDGATHITEMFEAESENFVEMQRQGWQAILDNFKRYAESGV